MQYGFVLDQNACIGCHACTVGCKAENDVPLGSFRTWVKWVEEGEFPETKRSAAVLRCNHCADAPCITICPTKALHKRDDGIVDLDQSRCIGCASCLQACPYDAIHIDERRGTAAKCHFCAHRLEVGVAPACVSVCPEQAIKVIDTSNGETMQLLRELGAATRKVERGTGPRTFYLGASEASLDPLAVTGARTLSHAEVPDPLPSPDTLAARAVYDTPKQLHWGTKIAAYMTTKALAAGALLLASASAWIPDVPAVALGWISFVGIAITALLLIADLHKPSRFYFLLTKPNPDSWLVRGGAALAAHGALSLPWALGIPDPASGGALVQALAVLSIGAALLSAVYTAFLFWQARGREMWAEDRALPVLLALQAVAAAVMLGALWGFAQPVWMMPYAAAVLVASLLPQRTAHARLAHRQMVLHPVFALGIAMSVGAFFAPPILLLGFFLLDWVYVHAGQRVALS